MKILRAIVLAGVLLPSLVTAAPASGPEISALSLDRDRLSGGAEVVVEGRNFTPDARLVLGDAVVADVTVESAERIRFRVPAQRVAGGRTLTVQTSAGVAQHVFHVLPPRLDEIADGEITSVAGGVPYLGDGGLATSDAVGLAPKGIAVDADGNVFVSSENRIRRIDAATGRITTYAGDGDLGYDGDGGPALAASFNDPRGLAFDRDGNLLVADWWNGRVRRIDAVTGVVSTIYTSNYLSPFDIATDASGDLYVAEYNDFKVRDGRLFRVDADTGESSVVDLGSEYSGRIGIASDGEGGVFITDDSSLLLGHYDPATGTVTRLVENTPGDFTDVLPDRDGSLLLVSEYESLVERFDPKSGTFTIVAGTPEMWGYGGDGGPATSAALFFPQTIAFDATGGLLIADWFNARLRRVAPDGTIATAAGSGEAVAFEEGWPATSTVIGTAQIAADRDGNVYAAEVARVVRVDAATGALTTFAGNGTIGFSGDGGPAAEASLSGVLGLAVDERGDLYIADAGNARVRRVDAATGVITTFAGGGEGGDGVPATEARLVAPSAIAVAGDALYIFDGDGKVRRVSLSTGVIRTLAEFGPTFGFGRYIAVDRSKNVYVSLFSTVVRISKGGGTKTIAGMENSPGSRGDGGPARRAFVTPFGLAFDRRGDLFLGNWHYYLPPFDDPSSAVRRIDARTKRIDTVAGSSSGNWSYSGDGGPALEAGFTPTGIAFDGAGNLYIADSYNGRVRVVKGLGRR